MADIVLTPQQRQAVETRGGALLVSAAAGSGKTRVLVDRVLGRLCDPDDPKNINDFLIITYTKAAAQELRGKIAAAISESLSLQPENRHLARQLSRIYLAQISTVHAFCSTLLRDYAHELGVYPDFRIADETECAEWQQQAMDRTLTDAYIGLKEHPDCRAFLDQLGAGRDDRTAARILMQAYNSVQCHPDPKGWIGECLQALELSGFKDMADTDWGKYLKKEFKTILDEQIQSMERGLARLSENAKAEEKYGPTFRMNLDQLRALQKANTWDEIHRGRITDFGKLSAVHGEDKEVLERLKRPRQQCMDAMKKARRARRSSGACSGWWSASMRTIRPSSSSTAPWISAIWSMRPCGCFTAGTAPCRTRPGRSEAASARSWWTNTRIPTRYRTAFLRGSPGTGSICSWWAT